MDPQNLDENHFSIVLMDKTWRWTFHVLFHQYFEKNQICMRVQFRSPKARLFWDSYRGCCLIYQQHDKYSMLLSHYISVSKSPLHSPEHSLQITKTQPDHPNDLYSTVGLGGGTPPADIGPPEAGAVLGVTFAESMKNTAPGVGEVEGYC